MFVQLQPDAQDSEDCPENTNTNNFSELLIRLRSNDSQAWLTLQRMYIPLARGYAKSVSQFSKIPKSELSEAAEFGLLKGIGEMRKPSFDIWKTGVVDFLKVHIREAISEVLKTQRPELSLNENWGDSDGFFNPLEPVSKEQDPAETVSDSTFGTSASLEPDTPLDRFAPDEVYPALGVVEGWLLKTHPELASDKGLSENQLSKKLGLSEKNIHRLRLKVRSKARARIKHSRLRRHERQGIHQPYPHLKALDRLALEKPLLIPVFGDSMGFFTPHQQKVLQLMGHFEMTPKQVAKTIACSEEALNHLAIEIVKKMDVLLKQKLAPEADFSFQEQATPQEELTKALSLELKLSGLSEAHLMRLPFASRQLLQKAYLDKKPIDTEEAIQMNDILNQLYTLAGQSPRQFRETLLSPLAPVLPHLATLDPLATQVVLGTIGQGQTVKEVARHIPKVTIAKAKEVLQDARVTLRQALTKSKMKSKPSSQPTESRTSELTPSSENQLLCESLIKEGLTGLTVEMMTRVITPYQHRVLVLRSQGKSYSDIAKSTGFGISPIKAAVIQGIQALKKELKQVYFPPLMAEAGLTRFTDEDQAVLSPQVSRVLRQYFIEEHSLEMWAIKNLGKKSEGISSGSLGQALNTDILAAIEQLPAKQKEILLDYVNQDVSFSELARQRNTPLTSVTSMVKAALINIEKSLNPFALEHWLAGQLQDPVATQDVHTHLSDPAQKLLMLLAKKDLHLAATVIELPKDLPLKEKLKHLDLLLVSAWTDLPTEIQTLINTMANGGYEISSLQGASDLTDAKIIYRDKVSPTINGVFKKVGAAPLGARLRLSGFDYVSQSQLFEALTPQVQKILEYYLSQSRDLKPLAKRVKGIALGEKDSIHWLQQEVERGFNELTPYQQEIWQQFSLDKFNAAAVARKIGKSQKAVAAAIRLMLNKLEMVWQQDSVLMTLNRQGIVGLRTPEQLEPLGSPVTLVLQDYFANGYSLEPFLKVLDTTKQVQTIEQQILAVKHGVEKAIDALTSVLQRNTLNAYGSGQYTNYAAIAEAVGLKPQDKNRVGSTIDAALKNLRAILENSPQAVFKT